MLPNRPHDTTSQASASDAAPDAEAPSAGARYRQHLAHFPERATDTALERAAKALIRIAQIRLRAPRKAN
jgi:hypothetical protein